MTLSGEVYISGKYLIWSVLLCRSAFELSNLSRKTEEIFSYKCDLKLETVFYNFPLSCLRLFKEDLQCVDFHLEEIVNLNAFSSLSGEAKTAGHLHPRKDLRQPWSDALTLSSPLLQTHTQHMAGTSGGIFPSLPATPDNFLFGF